MNHKHKHYDGVLLWSSIYLYQSFYDSVNSSFLKNEIIQDPNTICAVFSPLSIYSISILVFLISEWKMSVVFRMWIFFFSNGRLLAQWYLNMGKAYIVTSRVMCCTHCSDSKWNQCETAVIVPTEWCCSSCALSSWGRKSWSVRSSTITPLKVDFIWVIHFIKDKSCHQKLGVHLVVWSIYRICSSQFQT